jgi:hypothetical protein
VRVKPTAAWKRSIKTITAGSYGRVRRPPRGSFGTFSAETANWLIDQGYATAVGGDRSPKRANPSRLSSRKPDTVAPTPPENDDGPGPLPPSLTDWKASALEFLSTADKGDISARIKGVGPKTAEEIVEARNKSPLAWEDVENILSSSQVEAISTTFDQSQSITEA